MAKRKKLRTPADVEAEIRARKDDVEDAQEQITDAVSQARRAIHKEVIRLLKLLGDQSLPITFKISKRKRSKKWVFQVIFNESDVSTMPEVSKSIADISSFERAAEIKTSIVKEEDS